MKLKDLVDIYGFESVTVADKKEITSFSITGNSCQSVTSMVHKNLPANILEREVDYCELDSSDFYISFIIYLK